MEIYGLFCKARGSITESFGMSSKKMFKTKEKAEDYKTEFLSLCDSDERVEKGTCIIEVRAYELED